MRTAVVIPALDEAGNIATLVAELSPLVDLVVVADNGSSDGTGEVAGEAGAIVATEPRRGYGYACAAGSAAALAHGAEVVAYIDGDHSSVPDEIDLLLEPILGDRADLVLGSRTLGHIERGAMPPHQRFGNWLSATLMRVLYRVTVTDLGPYRAIRADLLVSLDMEEMSFGWPTEMMVKAANRTARILEVPVTWRSRREGRSKVGGTVMGSVLAARHILGVTIRHRRAPAASASPQ